MVMRIGGLASGMDIDELVKKLMSAEKAPLNKLQQKKQTYEWQRDAYRSVNAKLKTFDTYIADNLMLKTMNTKTAKSSNSGLVTATATGQATGVLSIEGVSQLATNARAVGEQISANGSTKMLDIPGNATGTIEIMAIQADGIMPKEATKIEITEDMTVDQFVSKLNFSNAGVTAVFESGRFSITAKNMGDNKSDDEIQIVSGAEVFEKIGFADAAEADVTKASGIKGIQTEDGKNAIFQVNGIATERNTNSFNLSGYNVTLNSVFNAEQATAEKYNAALQEWKNTSSTKYDGRIETAKEVFTDATDSHDLAEGVFNTAKETIFGANISEEIVKVYKKINNPQFASNVTANELSVISNKSFVNKTEYSAWLADTSEDGTLKTKLKDENISLDQFNALKMIDEPTLKQLASQSKYDILGVTFLSGLSEDEQSLIKDNLLGESEEDFNTQVNSWKTSTNETEKALSEKLDKLTASQKSTIRQLSPNSLENYTDLAVKSKDTDEKLKVKNTTEKEYNLLVDRQSKAKDDFINAYQNQKGQAPDLTLPHDDSSFTSVLVPVGTTSPVTLTSTTNVDEMLTKIKDFVSTYNALIKDFTDQTKETKYRDYTPLTDEQKEEMSENEIKLWEEKSKSGLLRNDSLVRDGLSKVRSLISQENKGLGDSAFDTLYEIGITTSRSYNDGGTLEIDEAKLRKALETDPDAVERLFKNSQGSKADPNHDGADTRGYFDKLRDSLKSFETNIEKKAGRSTMTETQYSIGKNMKDTESRIDTWKLKLENIEARYWKQFTAMESAINKANQQSSMFMQGQ